MFYDQSMPEIYFTLFRGWCWWWKPPISRPFEYILNIITSCDKGGMERHDFLCKICNTMGKLQTFPNFYTLHIFMFWITKFSRFHIKLDRPSRFSWSSFFTSITNYNHFVKTCSKFESVSWCYSLRVNRHTLSGDIVSPKKGYKLFISTST